MTTPTPAPVSSPRWTRLYTALEVVGRALPFMVILALAVGWYVIGRDRAALEDALITSYQETQLEIVRAVARSTEYLVVGKTGVGWTIADIEQEIFRRFVDPVRLLKSGDAWIYAPDHVVFDRSSDFPDAYRGKSMAEIFALQAKNGASHYEAMTADVMNAREGVGWYVWLPEKGKEIAAWTPVRIGGHVWTIGLSTPLPEILRATGADRHDRFVLVIMALATVLGVALSAVAIWNRARRRQLDAQLRAGNEELRRLVDELQGEIEKRKDAEAEQARLNEQLLQAKKMEAVGMLAGGVAHDLNNILTGLVSYPELLLLQLPDDSPLREPLGTIQKSGERAADVVQDLLTLSRRGVAVMEPLSLNQVVREYLDSPAHQRLRLEHPGVAEDVSLQDDLFNMSGSAVHLSKTVMNLVLNAYEAMPGGGTIGIRTRNRRGEGPVEGDSPARGGEPQIEMTVSDTGRGIAPQDLPRIFEPFYTKKVLGRSGSGLGLSVVWGAIQDHKGHIDVTSAEGKGTTFTLRFPATRESVGNGKSGPSRTGYAGRGEAVLVVDDVDLQRAATTAVLTALGYRPTAVASGEEAVERLAQHPAALVVLDMILGAGMDGLDTYREMLKIRPGQRAIITSGFSETDRVREAQRLGAGSYVRKPFLMDQIGIAIRRELDRT